MKERPMLFSAPMVRAILDGSKTQTRRVCKPMNAWVNQDCREVRVIDGAPHHFLKGAEMPIERLRSPHGQPGDHLWVRETCRADELPSGLDGVRYLADDSFIEIENSEEAAEKWGELACYGMKKSGLAECRAVPSIHMPRWASRILLEVTGVRVERLQSISEVDALAEGIDRERMIECQDSFDIIADGNMTGRPTPISCYRELWESINGPRSWGVNPWVWCIDFKRIKP
jgi:hypothetical protein